MSVKRSLQQNNKTSAIFLRFGKSFDTISHNLLLQVLEFYDCIKSIWFSGCAPPLASPSPLTFASSDQNSTSNLLLGLEWPSSLHPLPFQQGLDSETHYMDQQLTDKSTERDSVSMQSSILSDFVLLSDGIGERIDANLSMIGDQNEISIDPELLTLKSLRQHESETP